LAVFAVEHVEGDGIYVISIYDVDFEKRLDI